MSAGLLEQFAEAKRGGADSVLKWLTKTSDRWRASKWREAGNNHRIWGRNWAITRMRHVINKNERFPYPIENHLWSISETSRTIWGDNTPLIEWRAVQPSAVRQESLVNNIWQWIVVEAQWEECWQNLFNLHPQTGVCAAKPYWDGSAPRGGAPRWARIDQRLVTFDDQCRLNHRTAVGAEVRYQIDIDELKSKYPEFASKIVATTVDMMPPDNNRDGLLVGGMNSLYNPQQNRPEPSGELVQTWLRLRPCNYTGSDAMSVKNMGEEEPFLCITWIPGAGVIDEEVTNNGLQVTSAQLWPNQDSWVGISDFDQVYGMAVANDKLSILMDRFRSRAFAPALRKLRQTRFNIAGGETGDPEIWSFDNVGEMDSTKWLETPVPNSEALNAKNAFPEMIAKILGTDIVGPEAYLSKNLTAAAVQAAQEAVERKPRQKIRNAIPMVVDSAKVLLSLFIEHCESDIYVGEGEDGRMITAAEIRSLRSSNFAAMPANMKSGPLTGAGRINAYKLLGEFDVFNPQSAVPASIRADLIDLTRVPNAAKIKQELHLDAKAQLQLAAEQEIERLHASQGGPGSAGMPTQPDQIDPNKMAEVQKAAFG